MPMAGWRLIADRGLGLEFVLLAGLCGGVGSVIGSLAEYYAARAGGRPLIERYGKYLLITRKDIDRADSWFATRGEITILVGRLIPGVRHFISIPAGVSRMSVPAFHHLHVYWRVSVGACAGLGRILARAKLRGDQGIHSSVRVAGRNHRVPCRPVVHQGSGPRDPGRVPPTTPRRRVESRLIARPPGVLRQSEKKNLFEPDLDVLIAGQLVDEFGEVRPNRHFGHPSPCDAIQGNDPIGASPTEFRLTDLLFRPGDNRQVRRQ